ncbi:MAG: NIPSNAP family protein [Ignavibacteria bacterium]|nr:NIPSNAP family protein [Ignavibacteria bacterium]
MIAVRNVFNLKFGRAKEAKTLMNEAVEINRKNGLKDVRVFTDLTGPSYTIVFETYHESLADFESKLQALFGNAEWRTMYDKFTPLVESAHRQIFTVEV